MKLNPLAKIWRQPLIDGLPFECIVVEDYYEDPDAVRQDALRREFKRTNLVPGYPFPGRKARTEASEEERSFLRNLAGGVEGTFDSYYQIYPKSLARRSRVHGDPNKYSGLVYLNRGVDGRPGTSFYRHRESGLPIFDHAAVLWNALLRQTPPALVHESLLRDVYDESKWEKIYTVPIRYNRLVLFPGNFFHRNESNWGTRAQNSRLVHAFFIAKV